MENNHPNAKHRNPFTQSCWVWNASHAWLGVPREVLKRYNLEADISSFSYQKTHPDGTQIVFLEEDCDATKVIHAIGVNIYKIADGNNWIGDRQVDNHYFSDACRYIAS